MKSTYLKYFLLPYVFILLLENINGVALEIYPGGQESR